MLKIGKSVVGILFLKNQLLVDDSALSEKIMYIFKLFKL